MAIRLKRVYDEPRQRDGYRVLVDRIWPRGVSKEAAGVDLWLKEIAPSSALRRWFGHDPGRWAEFKRRYFRELDANPEAVEELLQNAGRRKLCLLFSARDEQHNNAVALKEYLERRG